MDRVVYFDLVGGASGDMLLAALVDAGAPLEAISAAIAAVGLRGVTLERASVTSAGLRACRVVVRTTSGTEGPATVVPLDAVRAARQASVVPDAKAEDAPPRAAPIHEPVVPDAKAEDAPPRPAPIHEPHPEHDRAHGHTHGDRAPRPRALHDHEPVSARFHRHVRESLPLHEPRPAPEPHSGHKITPLPVGSSRDGAASLEASAPLEGAEHGDHHGHRPYRVVRRMIEGATSLSERTRALALDAFARLGEAEAKAHGVALEEVTFHEVGSDDAIADVVGVLAALEALGVTEVLASPVPMGRGLTNGSHGPIPLPGPATLAILEGVPIEGVPLSGETVTPTAAAILRAVTQSFGPLPSMELERTGVGAGARTWPDRPNIVRAILGRRTTPALEQSDEDSIIETNLDDMSPEHVAALSKALFAAGAIDVWSHPISMKKGRTGVLVSVLVRSSLVEAVAAAMLLHSTTLGVRVRPVERLRGSRRMVEVETPFGRVRVKVADRPSGPALVSPEFDDCERLAERAGVSVRAVSEAALYAAWSMPKPAD